MNQKGISLGRHCLGNDEIDAVRERMELRNTAYGDMVREFEKSFAKNRYAVMPNGQGDAMSTDRQEVYRKCKYASIPHESM